jgi:hypothetical protein
VNKGLGNPFISGLDLRTLHPELYPDSSEAQSLVLLSLFRDDTVGFGFNRYHFGIEYQHFRYTLYIEEIITCLELIESISNLFLQGIRMILTTGFGRGTKMFPPGQFPDQTEE